MSGLDALWPVVIPGIIAVIDNFFHDRDNDLDDGGKNYIRAAISTGVALGTFLIAPAAPLIAGGIGLGAGIALKVYDRGS